jgi:hypothetical protein
MPKFKVGDRVERIGSLVPEYMRHGVITRVIPNKDVVDLFTEYEVNFDYQIIATFYETQLRLIPPKEDEPSDAGCFHRRLFSLRAGQPVPWC